MPAMTIHDQRRLVRQLIDDASPTDAPTAYYALFHPAERSTLVTRTDEAGRALGFAGRFRTGLDLFRPLVTLSCQGASVAADLLSEILQPGHPYILFANLSQLPLVGGSVRILQEQVLHIYRLDVARFQPEINVLVRCTENGGGHPRCRIESGGYQAVAGLNWQSPGFAEIYVHTDPEVRQRGWGRSVVAAISEKVVRGGRIPLYLVEHDNDPSRRLAESLGYVDTGARQVYAEIVYEGHPAQKSGR